MKIDDAGWLETITPGAPAVIRIPSVRTTALVVKQPLGVVWHWTGGPAQSPGYPRALAEGIRTFNRQVDRAASWHVLVAKDGTIIQSCPCTVGSWHVGRSGRLGGRPVKLRDNWDAFAWPGAPFANINSATIGVELVNSGRLEKVGEQFYCWPFRLASGQPDSQYEIEAARAVAIGGVWYDDFPQAQRDAAQRLLKALVLKFKWTREVSQYTHFHFDPTRKEDAGPVWMEQYLPKMLDAIFGPDAS